MKRSIRVFVVMAIISVNSLAQDTLPLNQDSVTPPVQSTSETRTKATSTATEKVEAGVSWTDYFGIAAFGLALISGLLTYLLRQNIDARIKNEAKKRVDEYEEKVIVTINENKKLIDKVMEQAGMEDYLLQNKRIWLVGESDRTIVKRVLKNVGFKTANLFEGEIAPTGGYEILFINNVNGSLDLDELATMANNQPEKVLTFYYNTNQKHFKTNALDKGKEDMVNFATNASQIYGNLLNTMKYQHRLS